MNEVTRRPPKPLAVCWVGGISRPGGQGTGCQSNDGLGRRIKFVDIGTQGNVGLPLWRQFPLDYGRSASAVPLTCRAAPGRPKCALLDIAVDVGAHGDTNAPFGCGSDILAAPRRPAQRMLSRGGAAYDGSIPTWPRRRNFAPAVARKMT